MIGTSSSSDSDDDHRRRQRREVEEDARQHDDEHDVDGQSDAIERVALDAPEDAPRLVDRAVDDRESRRGEDQRRGAARGVGRAGDGDAAIGLLQRRRVVDAVAGHGDDMTALLQRLDDRIFVLGEDAGEAVGALDRLGDVGRQIVRIEVLREHVGGRDDIVAEAELARRLLGDRRVVAGHHLDAQALGAAAAIVDFESSRGGSNIGSTPSTSNVLPSSSERATARAREPLAARSATVVVTRSAICGAAEAS